VLGTVSHATQQNVFEGDAFAGTERDAAHCGNDFTDRPLAVNGHDFGADRVVGRVEADGKARPHVERFFCEFFDAGHDAGGGDGHAPGAQADFADQQAHGSHEVIVIEEWLAHAHEDQIHAITADADGLAFEDRNYLACDFARGEVALQAQLCGEAKLAIDGATDLRGDADGGALPGLVSVMEGRLRFVLTHPFRKLPRKGWGTEILFGFSFVAGFAAIALGHPDRFHGLALFATACKLNEVALGAIHGLECAGDGRTADLPAFSGQSRAQSNRQSADFRNISKPLTIHGFSQLVAAESRLAGRDQKPGESFRIESK
jgi:hypothetical protein